MKVSSAGECHKSVFKNKSFMYNVAPLVGKFCVHMKNLCINNCLRGYGTNADDVHITKNSPFIRHKIEETS
jgi:hypothetical protein